MVRGLGDGLAGAAEVVGAAVDDVTGVDARRVIVVVVVASHLPAHGLAQPLALGPVLVAGGATHPVRRRLVVDGGDFVAAAEPAHHQGAHPPEGGRVLHHVFRLQKVVELRVFVVQRVVQPHVVEHDVAILLALKKYWVFSVKKC